MITGWNDSILLYCYYTVIKMNFTSIFSFFMGLLENFKLHFEHLICGLQYIYSGLA